MATMIAPRLSAAERSQLLKEDEAWVGKPFDVALNPRAMQANTRHMALTLLDTRLEYRASKAAAFAEALISNIMSAQVTETVACGKGCSYCCNTYVSATIPEVLNLAGALRANQARVARVQAAAVQSRHTPQHLRESSRIPCPMLEDRACSEYLHRPISCRYLLSTSLPACIRILQDNQAEAFPFAGEVVTIRSSIVIMMKTALILSGLPYQHVELNQALAVALRHDDSESRWLAGEPLFDGVPADQAEQATSQVAGLVNFFVTKLRPTL
jgi:Putative zinc- or iron-chelating domain